jgi:hypothetical protein
MLFNSWLSSFVIQIHQRWREDLRESVSQSGQDLKAGEPHRDWRLGMNRTSNAEEEESS